MRLRIAIEEPQFVQHLINNTILMSVHRVASMDTCGFTGVNSMSSYP